MREESSSTTSAPGGRAALLDRVVEHLGDAGSHDLTLRGVAAGVGTSHRMLIYHFRSLDGLVAAVVAEVERRQREALADLADSDVGLRGLAEQLWLRLRDEQLRPLERLFFQLYARALVDDREGAAQALVLPWLQPIEDLLHARGLDRPTARALARLGLAVTRGLLLDLLATGDDAGADAAMALYLQQLDAVEAAAGRAGATASDVRFTF